MTDRPRRVTTADIAREAGVSRGTVSYTLNGDPQSLLKDSTKQKVLDAAQRLGYKPVAAARLLGGGKARTVLFLGSAADGITPLMSRYIETLASELATHGLGLIYQLAVEGLPRPDNELTPAVVLTSPTDADPAFASLAAGFDVPVISAFPGRDAFIASAGATQADFLVSRGYTALIFVAPRDTGVVAMSRLREASAAEAAGAAGIPFTATVWPDERAEAVSALQRLLSQHPEPFGVCAYNDDVALQVLAAAADGGLTVPARFGVIGVDDTYAARYAIPALTSVSSDLGSFVAGFAAHIAAVAAGGSDPGPQMPEAHRIVERASTA